jgi:hypothetical protein
MQVTFMAASYYQVAIKLIVILACLPKRQRRQARKRDGRAGRWDTKIRKTVKGSKDDSPKPEPQSTRLKWLR